MISAPVSDMGAMLPYSAAVGATSKASRSDFSENLMSAMKQPESEKPDPKVHETQKEAQGDQDRMKRGSESDDSVKSRSGEDEKAKQTEKTDDAEAKTTKSENKDVSKAETTSEDESTSIPDEIRETLALAGAALMEQTAQMLGLTSEELQVTMDEMGIAPEELLLPDVLNDLALRVNGSEDMLEAVTDEALYRDLTALAEEGAKAREALAEELEMDPEELQDLIRKVTEDGAEKAVAETKGDVPLLEEAEDAAVSQTVEIQPATEAEEAGTTQQNGSQAQDDDRMDREERKEETPGAGQTQPVVTYAPEQSEIVSVREEAAVMHEDPQAAEIADQIMEYMKVRNRDELTEMEISLHPASLGNVNVALTARDGVITAQFTAQNEAVRAAIESQVVQLRQQMEDQGIKVEAVEVTVAGYDFHQQSGDQAYEHQEEKQPQVKRTRRLRLDDLENEEELEEDERIAADLMSRSGNSVDFTV